MWWMWMFALVFMQDLDWSFFYDNLGFWGVLYAYVIIGWGEVALYSYLAFKILERRKKYWS